MILISIAYQGLALKFIDCLMEEVHSSHFNESRDEYPGLICANKINLNNWNIVERCADSTEGDELLAEMGQLTNQLSPRPSFVPWVVFNEVNTELRIFESN